MLYLLPHLCFLHCVLAVITHTLNLINHLRGQHAYWLCNSIHRFWFKKFISIHNRLDTEMNKCIQKTEIPEWMTKGKSTLIQKDPRKGTAPTNYRTIMSLPLMWKILTAQIREQIYYSSINPGIFPDEQKGCHKRTRGTEEVLYKDQYILNKSKTRWKNLAMAWIKHKKLMIWSPQSWIQHCLKMYKISDQIVQFIKKTIQTWRVELTEGQSLAEVKIQRGIFQGAALSPLLFVIAMMPLNHILSKCTARYKISKSQEKINPLMTLMTSNCLPKTKRIGNPNINCKNICSRYRNGVRHRKMHHASNEKWQTAHNGRSQTTKSSSQQNTQRRGNLQILGNIGSWHYQTTGNERKKKKRVSQKSQKITDKTL